MIDKSDVQHDCTNALLHDLPESLLTTAATTATQVGHVSLMVDPSSPGHSPSPEVTTDSALPGR